MNILVIAHFQDDGSPYVSFVHEQVKEYVKLGHKVIVASPVVFGKKYKYLKNKKMDVIDRVPIYYLKHISLSKYGQYTINNWSGYIAIMLFVKRLLKTQTIDIIHAHTIGFDGDIAVRIKKQFGIPVVITTHGSDTIVEIRKGNGVKLARICNQADMVVAVSEKLKIQLQQLIPQRELAVIINGYNVEIFENIQKTPFSIIQVGSLISQKNVDKTIAAFSIVRRYFPEATLEIVGEGPEKIHLHQLCKELGVEDAVCFLGQLPNRGTLFHMAQSSVFSMPSVNEGFGIVYLEAMSQKCVVIGTCGEGIDGVVVNEKNGILVPANDHEALAEAIRKVFENPEYKKRLVEAGSLTAQRYTWKANAQEYTSLFQSILERRKGRI